MKKPILLILIAVSILLVSIFLVGFTFSGDNDLDSALSELNVTANLNFGDFKADICLGYNLSESKFDNFSGVLKLESADIFMVVELGRIAEVPVDKVVEIYQANKAKGWGYIAKQLGIKPGSAAFKALKSQAQGHSAKLKNKNESKGKGKNKNN